MFKTISNYDYKKNRLIYTFQKSNLIHIADIKSKKDETFEIEKLTTIDFPKDKLRNISFTRRYLKQNDKISKILVDGNSNIYVIVKFQEKNENKYRVYSYNPLTKNLNYANTKLQLFTDMAFIKHDKLYVPNENKCYTIFSTPL